MGDKDTAYSEQVSSAGFWPGGRGIDYPAFYSYASPAPPGFSSAPIRPAQAFWSRDLNEYILPYDAVRTAGDPEQTLMEFLTSTYEAAATTGNWDRTALECPLGAPGVPRPIAQSRQRVRASPSPEGEPPVLLSRTMSANGTKRTCKPC